MQRTLKKRNNGFTLLEVIVVIITLAILASVAVPRYTRSLERARAAEATYTLGTILSSMERYYLENGNFPPTGNLTTATGLDIEPPLLKYFGIPDIDTNCSLGSFCSRTKRITGTYHLEIYRDGTIKCLNGGGGEPTCQDAGYP